MSEKEIIGAMINADIVRYVFVGFPRTNPTYPIWGTSITIFVNFEFSPVNKRISVFTVGSRYITL